MNPWCRYAANSSPCTVPSLAFGWSRRTRRTTSRHRIRWAFFLEENATKQVSATSASETQYPPSGKDGSFSQTAFGYWIGVHASSGIRVIAPVTALFNLTVTENHIPALTMAATRSWR